MKSHSQQRASGSGRSAKSTTTTYMSEQQLQAYLMARDAIRRVQRTAPIFDAIDSATAWGKAVKRGRRDSH